VAIGDLHGDGKPDLAVANANGNNVSVLLDNGDGTFQAHVDYGAGAAADAGPMGSRNLRGLYAPIHYRYPASIKWSMVGYSDLAN
jgi:FG-GAP-like repeat